MAQSPVTRSRSASITGLPASSTPTSIERLTQMFSMHSNHGVGFAMVKATGTIQLSWLIAGSETETWTSSPTKTHQPVAVVSDQATCTGATDTVVKGAESVLIGGKPVARMGDPTAHGGVIVMGMPTVIVGASNTSSQIQALRAASRVGRPLCEL